MKSTSKPKTSQNHEQTDSMQVRDAQVQTVIQHLPIGYLADIVTGAFLCLILFFGAANQGIFAWYAILVFCTAIRFFRLKHHQKNSSVKKQYDFLVNASLLGGVIWGLSPLVWSDNPSFLEVAVIALWLSGMLAGAAATFSVIKKLFFCFAIPPSVLFVFFAFLRIEENAFIYASAYVMYLGFIVPIGIRISNDLNGGIALQIQNSKLQVQLRQDELRLKAREDEVILEKKLLASSGLQPTEDERLLLLDSVSEGIYGINSSGHISFINASALNLLGYSEAQVLGKSALDLINSKEGDPDQISKQNQAFVSCFKDGLSLQNVDGTFYGALGRQLPVRFSCRPVRNKSEVIGTVVSFSDLTKQREMEAMLLQSQKMEAIGRLTGGVAHDFNNLLTVIMGNLHFLEKRFANDEKTSELFQKIMNAAKSGAELNNRLLSFSREQAIVNAPVDLNEMLEDMREFLDRILGEEITLVIRKYENSCVALTDRIQLENAILNLCINARDAMPSGGELTIITRNGTSSESYIDDVEDKGFSTLSVIDTGTGMSLDLQKQIFDPFFTTKEKHKGTGLGLSTVYGFLKQSGGNIIVNSQLGKGTKFTLFIPAADQLLLPERPGAESKPPQVQKRAGTILVVEDDPDVREVAAQILIQAGFSVIVAGDGPTGLIKFETHPEIDLVFSDVIMPGGMTGIEMAEIMLKNSPDSPILLTTGYTEKVLKNRIEGLKNIVCVSKPYDTNKLPGLISSLIHDAA